MISFPIFVIIACFVTNIQSVVLTKVNVCDYVGLMGGMCQWDVADVTVDGYTTLNSYFQRLEDDSVPNPRYAVNWLAEKGGLHFVITQTYHASSGKAASSPHIQEVHGNNDIGIARVCDSTFASCYQDIYQYKCNIFDYSGNHLELKTLTGKFSALSKTVILSQWDALNIIWFDSGVLKIRRYSFTLNTIQSEAVLESGIVGTCKKIVARKNANKIFIGYIMEREQYKFRLFTMDADTFNNGHLATSEYEGANIDLFDMAVLGQFSVLISGNFRAPSNTVFSRNLDINPDKESLVQIHEFQTSGSELVTDFKYLKILDLKIYASAYTTENSVYVQAINNFELLGSRFKISDELKDQNYAINSGKNYLSLARYKPSNNSRIFIYQENGFKMVSIHSDNVPLLLIDFINDPSTINFVLNVGEHLASNFVKSAFGSHKFSYFLYILIPSIVICILCLSLCVCLICKKRKNKKQMLPIIIDSDLSNKLLNSQKPQTETNTVEI